MFMRVFDDYYIWPQALRRSLKKRIFRKNPSMEIIIFTFKMNKSVKYILPAIEFDMGGFPVKQSIPTQRVDQIDPFLLLHHAW